MAKSLANLPSEILFKIFDNNYLSSADIARSQQVCKLFKHHAVHRVFTFRVGAPSLSPWKLASRIIFDGIGVDCTGIVIRWEYIGPRTFSRDSNWSWTDDEIKHIKEICDTWGFFGDVKANILKGSSSISLLPLVLRFTPRLKSVELELTNPTYTGSVGEEGSPEPESPSNYPLQHRGLLLPERHRLWFLEYPVFEGEGAAKIPWAPDGLESFAFYGDKWCALTPADFTVLLTFPRLKDIKISRIFAPLGDDGPPKYPDTPPPLLENLSLVFSLSNCWFYQFYEKFWKILAEAGRLKSVYIRTNHEGICEEQCLDLIRSEETARFFLQKNPETLKPEDVLVNGSGFNPAGQFLAHAEEWRAGARRERGRMVATDLTPKMKSLIMSLTDDIISNIISHLDWRAVESAGCLGLKHIECLQIYFQDLRRELTRLTGLMDLMEVLTNRVIAGYTPNLKDLRIHFHRGFSGENIDVTSLARLFGRLKAFSEGRLPDEFSIRVRSEIGILLHVPLDYPKITKLELEVDSPTTIEEINANLTHLASILSTTARLKELYLRFDNLEEVEWYFSESSFLGNIEDSLGVLEELQRAVSALKGLETLEVYGVVVHPSFLLKPPENCTKVTYEGQRSAMWWRKFAKCDFKGVKWMCLDCEDLGELERETMKISGEEMPETVCDVILGAVEVCGLEWFAINALPAEGGWEATRTDQRFPTDLVKCVLARNEQLPDICIEKLAKDFANMLGGRSDLPPRPAEVEEFRKGLPEKFCEVFDPKFQQVVEKHNIKMQKERNRARIRAGIARRRKESQAIFCGASSSDESED
ncbi:hypothetical protein TWF281_003976 [Arthrobotrys megalospora]